MDKASRRIVVIGGGTMGLGIAAGFLAHGTPVTLLVRTSSNGAAASDIVRALASGLSPTGSVADLMLATHDEMAGTHAWHDVALVIESVPEDLQLKQALFAWLDAHVPIGIPIGSNSSSHPISRIADRLATRSRMFGMHYFMPAHMVPLVEVVLGADSDALLAQQVCGLFEAAGKKPVLVKRDIAGFLANRIQHALMREALALVDAGIASAEDVDTAVRYSFGFRYAAIGPIVQKEISGWASTAAAAREIFPTLSNASELPACLERLIDEGKLGMASGEGFFTWTPETAQATRAVYVERLGAALKLLA